MANSTQEMFRVKWTSLPRPVLMAVAVIFCVATATYALIWMIDTRRSVAHPVEIGFNQARDTRFDKNSESIPIYNVPPGSPAERAGLQAGDEIIGLNGQVLTSYELFDKVGRGLIPGMVWTSRCDDPVLRLQGRSTSFSARRNGKIFQKELRELLFGKFSIFTRFFSC